MAGVHEFTEGKFYEVTYVFGHERFTIEGLFTGNSSVGGMETAIFEASDTLEAHVPTTAIVASMEIDG